MSTDPWTIASAGSALRAGKTTSVELTQAAIDTADRLESYVGSFITRLNRSALEAAEVADSELAAGRDRGPLHGIPLGVKDIIAVTGTRSTAQSLVLDPAWGEQGDAPVVTRLRESGAVIVGKTTTSEFAIGFPDPDKPFPIPRNPWDLSTWPGGSSSGTANGVAAGFFLGGLGSDSGGSIRIPASFTGITGLKPTYGRVPKAGVAPLGYTFDHVGPLARSARDNALLLQAIAGPHPADSTTSDVPVPDYVAGLTGDLRGVRIGVDRLTRVSGSVADPQLAPAIEAALAELAEAGAQLVDVEIPYYGQLTTATYVGFLAEAAAYHAPDLQNRWNDYGRFTRTQFGSAVFTTAADYVQIQRVRRVGQKAVAELFKDVDLVVTPTTSRPAIRRDELAGGPSSGSRLRATIHTGVWNATGNPALALPIGFTEAGLPLSLQIAGRPFDEVLVLRAGDAFQQRTNWHLREAEVLSAP
jgi:aspartyl-tRNA(Asn)/glutamyl-tRNA(Gln) amidotransferase subunit A